LSDHGVRPDFARIDIDYVPNRLCVETKSLKFYLASYRNERAFNETVTNRILEYSARTVSRFRHGAEIGAVTIASRGPHASQNRPDAVGDRFVEGTLIPIRGKIKFERFGFERRADSARNAISILAKSG